MKRGNTYSVRYNYKDHAGKPCKGWETFKTKAEAQERKITVEKELLDGTFLVPDAMTVEEMLYKWIPIQSSKHKWSPKTYTQSVAMVQNLIVPYIGKRKVQDLRTYDIEQFYATLSQTPCGQYVHGEKQDEQNAPEKYSNCGQLFRLPDGLPIAPDVLTKWYRMWRAEHPEFEKIVFHGLRHSSATYQLLQSGGDFKSMQGNTGHATATVLMDTYAHTQDKPRVELTEKIEADFYSQDVAGAKPQEPPENKTPVATKITGKMILEAIRQMGAEERRELTRVLFA